MNITVNKQNDLAYEAMLDSLIQEVFGFSFAPWFERKLWDDRYESYSIIEDGKMLANVCIYKSEMLIKGKKVNANQFGAVATSNEARGRGLSRLLIEHVLSIYPDTPAYLAANPSVIDFYPQFGFRQIKTYNAGLEISINNKSSGAIKCKIDDKIVIDMLSGKRLYSSLVDCTNSQSIQMFHLIMSYSDNIYYLPKCKALVVAVQEEDELFMADVITKTPICFNDLVAELPFNGVSEVGFGFCPDWLNVDYEWEQKDMEEEPHFIRGEWELPEKFCFPAMSET